MATTYDEAVPDTPTPPRDELRSDELKSSSRATSKVPPRDRSPQQGSAWAALTGGLLVAAIGIVEVLAWHLHWTAALRFRPSYTPMLYNTALALAVTGAAIASAVRGPSRWLRFAGVVDVVLGGASLVQYAVGWDLQVDELFARAYLVSSAEDPGRMAVNTAVCLVLIGTAFLVWRPDARRWRSAALTAAATVVASISIVALFGHLAGLPDAYDWQRIPMSLLAALSMTVVATCLLALAYATRTQRDAQVFEWIAGPVGTAAFAITVLLWFMFAEMGQSTQIAASEASRAVLFLTVLSGGMLALMTWLAQHAMSRRRGAEALTGHLRDEMALREQAEASVRASALLLHQFLDSFPVGLFICEPDGRPYLANRVAMALLGQGAALTGTVDRSADDRTFVAGTDQPYPPERLPSNRAAAGESSHVDDLEIHLPRGSIPLEVWGTPLTDETGRVRFGLAAFVDISQRRASEQALARHAALLDLAHDVIYIRDAHRRITYWNHRAELTYGWTREEAVGQAVYHLLHTEFPAPIEDIEDVLRREGQWQGELVQHTKSGARTIVACQFVAEPNPDGTIATVMAINTDITARKAAEAKLARHSAELAALNLELSRSNDELEQFAYVASHDLSEPLRAISGPVSLLARRYEGQLDADADRFIGFAVDGCERMQTLINDLLAFSRIGRQDLDVSTLDTNAVVDAALAAVRVATDECHAQVTRDDLPAVSAVASQLGAVFQNLVSNAIKFTAPDVEPRVHIGAQPGPDGYRFAVTDNGIGIDVEHRQRIFGMFKRLHTRDAYPGTGIGLALCKKIVERQGGTIGVEDGPHGHGSTFWFTIPTCTLPIRTRKSS